MAPSGGTGSGADPSHGQLGSVIPLQRGNDPAVFSGASGNAPSLASHEERSGAVCSFSSRSAVYFWSKTTLGGRGSLLLSIAACDIMKPSMSMAQGGHK
jgi:hypothetical protein